MCELCQKLLSEGLDLCVRARTMGEMDRRAATLAISAEPDAWVESGLFDEYVARHNELYPDTQISTRSATVAVWLEDQYQKDLADWERRARDHMTKHVFNT